MNKGRKCSLMDEETGLYYYGARYMNPITSLWYGVDLLAEKFVTTGGYVYTLDNPIKLVDPDGKRLVISGSRKERLKTLGSLQQLTNDNLFVNGRGVVSIGKRRWDNRNKKLTARTALLREVIGNKKHTVTINKIKADDQRQTSMDDNWGHINVKHPKESIPGSDARSEEHTSELQS